MFNEVNFLFELGYLQKIKRSAKKNNSTSIAGHTFRVALIGYILAKKASADSLKTAMMCLLHDVPETRTTDLDLVSRRYVSVDENMAFTETIKGLDFEKELKSFYKEYQEKKTLEAKLTNDADIIEELLTEKAQFDSGDKRAKSWISFTIKRIKTSYGKDLAKKIINSDSDEWWKKIASEK